MSYNAKSNPQYNQHKLHNHNASIIHLIGSTITLNLYKYCKLWALVHCGKRRCNGYLVSAAHRHRKSAPIPLPVVKTTALLLHSKTGFFEQNGHARQWRSVWNLRESMAHFNRCGARTMSSFCSQFQSPSIN